MQNRQETGIDLKAFIPATLPRVSFGRGAGEALGSERRGVCDTEEVSSPLRPSVFSTAQWDNSTDLTQTMRLPKCRL